MNAQASQADVARSWLGELTQLCENGALDDRERIWALHARIVSFAEIRRKTGRPLKKEANAVVNAYRKRTPTAGKRPLSPAEPKVPGPARAALQPTESPEAAEVNKLRLIELVGRAAAAPDHGTQIPIVSAAVVEWVARGYSDQSDLAKLLFNATCEEFWDVGQANGGSSSA